MSGKQDTLELEDLELQARIAHQVNNFDVSVIEKFIDERFSPNVPANNTSPSRILVQDISSFVEKHKASLDMDEDTLKSYVEKEQLTNLDALDVSVRNFILSQNSAGGRQTGYEGAYTHHTIDSEAGLGPETHRQRLKREGIERWWQSLLALLSQYTKLYEDTYRMYRTALLAVEDARQDIREKLQDIIAAMKENNKNQQKFGKDYESEKIRKTNRDAEIRLKEELEDINMFEREVLVPVGKQLEEDAPDETELQRIQRKIRLVMPGRAFRFFLGLMNTLRPKFNSFPPLNRVYKPLTSTPVPNLMPQKMEINIKPGQTGSTLYKGHDPEEEAEKAEDDDEEEEEEEHPALSKKHKKDSSDDESAENNLS